MSYRLILASSSPRRSELLHLLQIPFDIIPGDVDETIDPSLPPSTIVETLSMRKAQAVHQHIRSLAKVEYDDAVIIGADTIVVQDGKVLGKPADGEEAYTMLQALQGKTHEVYSGIACIQVASRRQTVVHRSTRVTMKSLTPQKILKYIESGEPMDKAGAYGIQGLGAILVDRIEGDYFNVVGLPISLLSDILEEYGILWEGGDQEQRANEHLSNHFIQ